METEKRILTSADVLDALKIIATQPKVSLEIFEERVKICLTCTRLKQTPKGQMYCGVCKCSIGKSRKQVFNLAAYKEKIPKHGCLHPSRGLANPKTGQIFGWRR